MFVIWDINPDVASAFPSQINAFAGGGGVAACTAGNGGNGGQQGQPVQGDCASARSGTAGTGNRGGEGGDELTFLCSSEIKYEPIQPCLLMFKNTNVSHR